jgi:hypothetical protein
MLGIVASMHWSRWVCTYQGTKTIQVQQTVAIDSPSL